MVSKELIISLLDNVIDPELGMKVTDLGLIYRVEIVETDKVEIDFTLTYPGCPAADAIFEDIEYAVSGHDDVKDVKINIVWNPPWSPEKMSEEARLMLGYPI